MRKVFTLFCICLSLTSEVSFSQVNLGNGLSAYYPFNSSFMDMSGNNNNGTAYGGVTFGTDHVGNGNAAAYFDGIDDWVSINSAVNLTPSSAMTLAFRYKAMDDFGQQVMISKGNFTGTTTVQNIQYQVGVFCSQTLSSDNLFFGTDQNGDCTTPSGFQSDYLFNTQVTDTNQWYCVVMTFDNGLKRMYVDGNMVAQQIASSTLIDSCHGGVLKFGVWWENDSLLYNGYLDEIRFYKRVLNTQEIDSVCNLNSPGTTEVASALSRGTINIIPNPATDHIRVEVPISWGKYSVEISNALGQKTFASEFRSDATIDVLQLPVGHYMIKCRHGSEVLTARFVRQ